MKRYAMITAAVAITALSGCSSDQFAKFSAGVTKFSAGAEQIAPKIEAACADLVKLTAIAEYVPAVGSIVPWVNGGCKAVAGLAKLSANADESLVWIGSLKGKVEALANSAGIKLPQ